MFKCLSSQSPQYLSQLFSASSSHYNTRSSSSSQLNLPVLKFPLAKRLSALLELHCGGLCQQALGHIGTSRPFPTTVKTFLHDRITRFLLLITAWHVILSLHEFDTCINFNLYIFCTQLDSNERK